MKTNKAMKRLYPWLIMRNVWNDEVIDSDDDTIELDLKDTLLTENAFSGTQIIPGTKGKIILQLDLQVLLLQ